MPLKRVLVPIITILSFVSCAQTKNTVKTNTVTPTQTEFTLNDFLQNNTALDAKVDSALYSLDDTAKVAQVLMPAVGRMGEKEEIIDGLVKKRMIGGLLLLNGTKDQCTGWVNKYDSINLSKKALPFLYSADAEPSLFNRKITGTPTVKKANEHKTIEEVIETTKIISKELNDIGINYNFSPVVDMSANATVGYRGFGQMPENIVPFSNQFIKTSQEMNVIGTAKHFPGHGLVSGDTHKALQVIDGELKEIHNYPPLIADGVLSIMVAHIAVENNKEWNTSGLPSTTSYKIVTELLKDSLQFNGLIVTDAMNMGGVTAVPQAELQSIVAGCDISLMPKNTPKAFNDIYTAYQNDADFKLRLEASVKKIIRMKICLGLL